ncbi:MAG TPA: Rho termination factor N-terminal domain-containing protein, partial [Nitrolancea sp.]|nr:Rho termination factor N-terminal domain-containing protein [Nitrolancea sp.]
MTITISELETKTLPELQDLAKDLEVSGYSRMKKHD